MAFSQYEAFVSQIRNDKDFDTIHNIGEKATYPRIYYCKICEQAMTAIEGDTITTERHSHDKSIAWQFVVKG